MKEFAPGFERNSKGWILYPSSDEDATFRKTMFPPEAMAHPARAPMFLVKSLIEYVSEVGETLLDPMSGSGTIMVGALIGRNIVCIELENIFQEALLMAKASIELDTLATITVLQGDCRDFLPIPGINHVIFSPPYAQILTTRKPPKQDSTKSLAGVRKGAEDGTWSPKYTENPRNIGRLNKFIYNQTMEQVYKLCYDSLPVGGTMSVILKDYIKQGRRVYLSDWLQRTCIRMGFEQLAWFKRAAPGTGFLNLWRSRGYATVDEEDMVIFRRVK